MHTFVKILWDSLLNHWHLGLQVCLYEGNKEKESD